MFGQTVIGIAHDTVHVDFTAVVIRHVMLRGKHLHVSVGERDRTEIYFDWFECVGEFLGADSGIARDW